MTNDPSAPVQVRAEGPVRIITLNRPRELNALNIATMKLLNETVQELRNDPSVGALIITGAGRSFVAGADVNEFLNKTPAEVTELARNGQITFANIEQFPKPVLALVNGFALGGGNELAMAAHYRIAVETAQMGQPEITLGLPPGFAGTQRLALLVGPWDAAELLANCDNISPADAQAIGLVDEVVPVATAMQRALQLAQAWASGAAAPPARIDARQRTTAQQAEYRVLLGNPAFQDVLSAPEPSDPSDREAARRYAARGALEAMKALYEQGFEAGQQAEADLFGKIVTSPSGQYWVNAFLKRDAKQRERSIILDLAKSATPPAPLDTFTMPQSVAEFYQTAAALLGIPRPVATDSGRGITSALTRTNGGSKEAGERLQQYEAYILSNNPSDEIRRAAVELGPIPIGKVLPEGQPVPLLRWAYTYAWDAPAGTASEVYELTVRPTPAIRTDDVLIFGLGSAAEANAGRWLPYRRPADVPAAHGQRFHTPGNNIVGVVIAAGEDAQKHFKVGQLVVTHNSCAPEPLGSRMLRDDPDMEGMVVRGYDEFRARPDAPVRSGAHAQIVTAKWLETVAKPEQLTIEESVVWALPDPTIWHNFRMTRLGAGETLLLIGASGSTGVRAIEIAKSLGVRRVIGMVSEPDKAADIRRRSTPQMEVVPIMRNDYDFATAEGRAQFVAKVLELNEGKPADVALDFLGSNYPQAFLAAVKRGNPSDPSDLGGRFTSYGAELGFIVNFDGTASETTPAVMFERVDRFRNIPGTDEILAAARRMLGDEPEYLEAIERARASAADDRKIKRVVVWGADAGAQAALREVQSRGAKAAVLVNGEAQAQAAKAALDSAGLSGVLASDKAVVDIAPYIRNGRIDSRTLLADLRGILGDRPDVVVDRADQKAVLGIENGEQSVDMSLNWLRPGGQVILFEKTEGHTYPYDIRAWVTQKDILLPDCSIILTHYASQSLAYISWEAVRDGRVKIDPPHLYTWDKAGEALDNQGRGKNVILHGIPAGLRTLDEVRTATR